MHVVTLKAGSQYGVGSVSIVSVANIAGEVIFY